MTSGQRLPWYRKATVQAAAVAGLCGILASALGGYIIHRNTKLDPVPVAITIVPPPAQGRVRDVPNFNEPIATGLVILNDFRVVDLRGATVVPEANRLVRRISPVTVTRSTIVRRTSPQAVIEFEFATRGFDVDARCLTHTDYELVRSTEPHYHGDLKMNAAYKLIIHLPESQGGGDEDVLVVTEATYWNNIQPSEDEWNAVALPRTKLASLIVLFPLEHPYVSYDFYFGPHGVRTAFQKYAGLMRFASGQHNEFIFWEVPEPREGYGYQLRWKWSLGKPA